MEIQRQLKKLKYNYHMDKDELEVKVNVGAELNVLPLMS